MKNPAGAADSDLPYPFAGRICQILWREIQETIDCRDGGGAGRCITEAYGYQVIHDTGVYDLVDGVLDRSAAYDYARDGGGKYPGRSIQRFEVVIDLHRDGVEGQKFVTEIDGKPTFDDYVL